MGESAYRAHQSLNYLIRRLSDGDRFDVVIFYDGVNEVSAGCRTELSVYSHFQEGYFRSRLERQTEVNTAEHPRFQTLVEPILYVTRAIGARIGSHISPLTSTVGPKSESPDFYNCHVDQPKAQKLADFLIMDWLIAAKTVEMYGGKFLAVLQPVSYLSRTKLHHIDIDSEHPNLRHAYETVYPRIRNAALDGVKEKGLNFIDLSSALDVDDWVYVDFCHLSPNGNQIIANILADKVSQLLAQ
jgi:hypothetical protein